MKRALTFLCLNLALAPLASGGAPRSAAPRTETAELEKFYNDNPEIKKREEARKKRMKEQQQSGEADQPLRPDSPNFDEDARADIAARAAAHPDSYMQDLIAEYLEEKGQLVEENIWSAAEELATPETKALYREYLRLVYQRKAGGGDRGYHTDWINSRLEQPNGWRGSFPSLKIGPLPKGVAGLWSGGDITLIGLDLCVLSHEWYHHTDNANGMDGNSHRHEQPEPWENLAYGEMCKEV
ncbi:MAG: hypothetical protein HY928_09815 [Elusimicrobia bacterium]|nr:hypothetical protein [Elusimicrobiota bacterium]